MAVWIQISFPKQLYLNFYRVHALVCIDHMALILGEYTPYITELSLLI